MNLNLSLNRREKLIVGSAVVFIIVFILARVIIFPVFEKRDELRHRLAVREKVVEKMVSLAGEHKTLKKKAALSQRKFSARKKGFTLFSFMDRLAGDINIKEKIAYMKPATTVDEASGLKLTSVELKLQDITLNDLSTYLFKVETSENLIKVRRLSIKKNDTESGLLSVIMQVETLEST
ncbi:MAG: type II secretion system protein M [Deltaproteobacteria bacterium]|nr:type II secretion system protein M [Deltaproteobacteria bacterium]